MFQITFLGAGHLGELILKAWLDKKAFTPKNVSVYLRSKKSATKIKSKYKTQSFCLEKNDEIPMASIYLIAVRPAEWPQLREKLLPILKKNKKAYCISIMAGIKASELEAQLGCPCLVAMTNTCLQVGKALSSQYASPSTKAAQKKACKKLFEKFGPVFELDESKFSRATALGGSHPAFVLWIINQALKITQEELGIKDSLTWTQQVFAGALALTQKEPNIDKLITQVATPGGCTQEGLNTLEALQISSQLKEVFKNCWLKAETLGKK